MNVKENNTSDKQETGNSSKAGKQCEINKALALNDISSPQDENEATDMLQFQDLRVDQEKEPCIRINIRKLDRELYTGLSTLYTKTPWSITNKLLTGCDT